MWITALLVLMYSLDNQTIAHGCTVYVHYTANGLPSSALNGRSVGPNDSATGTKSFQDDVHERWSLLRFDMMKLSITLSLKRLIEFGVLDYVVHIRGETTNKSQLALLGTIALRACTVVMSTK